MRILGLIPARKGSKSITNKNIRLINGKPLLAYSVEHAAQSKLINRILVSTDSDKYGRIARKHGAEYLFLRPGNISGDKATDLEVFKHALDWLLMNENYVPDICVHLRPTYPIRDPQDIDNMIKIITGNPEIDSVRSVAISPETPYKMWSRNEEGYIKPLLDCKIPEAYNQPRQILPVVYLQNACIDVIRTSTILHKKSMTGDRIYGYIMEQNWDVDLISQLKKARKAFKHGK
jgi:CMP-N,N'-diacetyllegionaminic acid synthase